jgi:hypothetical protein
VQEFNILTTIKITEGYVLSLAFSSLLHGINVKLLTVALVGAEWSASRSGRFTSGERSPSPGTQREGGWMDPRTGLTSLRIKILLLPGLELTPRLSSPWPVSTSCYRHSNLFELCNNSIVYNVFLHLCIFSRLSVISRQTILSVYSCHDNRTLKWHSSNIVKSYHFVCLLYGNYLRLKKTKGTVILKQWRLNVF